MGFESGSFAVSFFRLPEKLPENYLELFSLKAAGKLDDVPDEPEMGWVSGRHLLEKRIDEQTSICGGHLFLNMRIAERKIPTVLLKAICRREELSYMEANNAVSVPSKVRKDIKINAIETNLRRMPPSLTGIPMVVDLVANTLYVGTTSTKQIDDFISFFVHTIKIEPYQMDMNEMMFRLYQKELTELPSISISEGAIEDEPVPARDFLTWLWYYSETGGGKVSNNDFGSFEAMVEGPLTFTFSADEARGAGETTVKKGSPLRSAEAKAALTVGKKLKKAKLTIVRNQDIWTGTFDADKFAFSGLSLPEGEEMEPHSRFAERINFLNILQSVIQEYFKKFVDTLLDSQWGETEQAIMRWARERDSF